MSALAADPISVIATFKEAKAQGRLPLLIEAESLLNDGTAAVAFGVVVAMVSGRQIMPLEIAGVVFKTIGGGKSAARLSLLERFCSLEERTTISLKSLSRPSPPMAHFSWRIISGFVRRPGDHYGRPHHG